MLTPVDVLAGVLWSAAYVLIIRRTYLDKAYGMPVVALCSNLAWEILALTLRPVHEITPAAWFCVPPDVIMFVQCLIYGRSELKDPLLKKYFHPMVLAAFAYAFALTYLFEVRLHDDYRYYTAYLGNLVMSALFIAMLLRRGSSRGQSMYIAICKLLGTAAVTVECLRVGRDPQPQLIVLLGAGIFVLDAVYAVMLHAKLVEERIDPWRRA